MPFIDAARPLFLSSACLVGLSMTASTPALGESVAANAELTRAVQILDETQWDVGRIQSARASLQALAARSPDDPSVLIQLSRAQRYLAAAVRFSGRADAAPKQDELQPNLDLVTRALKTAPQSVDAHLEKAAVLLSVGNGMGGKSEAELVLRDHPENVRAQLYAAHAFELLAEPDAALKLLGVLLEGSAKGHLRAECYSVRAMIESKLHQPSAEEADLKAAIEALPGDPWARYQYALFLLGAARYDEAVSSARSCLSSGDIATCHQLLSSAYRSRGENNSLPAEAAQDFKSALEEDPADFRSLQDLWKSLESVGDAADCRERLVGAIVHRFMKEAPDGHLEPTDFELLERVAAHDVLWVASTADWSVAEEAQKAEGRPYHLKKLQAFVSGQARFERLTRALRRRLDQATFSVPVSDAPAPLMFEKNEFILPVISSMSGVRAAAEPLPECRFGASRAEAGLLNVCSWHRLSCKRNDGPFGLMTICRASLAGMPAELKDRFEDEFGKTFNAQWRWDGVGELDGRLQRLRGLRIEFIDQASGRPLWVAK